MGTGYLQAEKSGTKTQKEVAVMRSLPVLHVCVCVCLCVCISEKDQHQIHWAVWSWKEISTMHRR